MAQNDLSGRLKEVYDHVMANHGVSIVELAEEFRMTTKRMSNYLDKLEDDHGLVKSSGRHRGKPRLIYPVEEFPVLGDLRQSIHDHVMVNPGVSLSELAEEFDMSKQGILKHLNKLEDVHGLIRSPGRGPGRQRLFYPVDESTVYGHLKEVYDHIVANPGVSVGELAEKFDVTKLEILRNLDKLEDVHGLVKSSIRRRGKRRLVYPASVLSDLRQRVYEHIVVNPGVSLSGLAEELDISKGLMNYHLDNLEDVQGLIKSASRGKRRLVYPVDEFPGVTDRLKEVYDHIVANPGISVVELAEKFSMTKPGILHNLNKLEDDHGLIKSSSRGPGRPRLVYPKKK